MLAILLLALAQVQLTSDAYFIIGDPVIEDGYVYFQGSQDVLTTKTSNDLGTLYTYANSDPEFTFADSGDTVTLTLPVACDSMIISGAVSRMRREIDNAWLIAVADKDGYVYVWRLQTATPEYLGSILIPNPHKITALSFSYQCTKILIGSEYGRAFRYDLPMNPWTLEYVNQGWHPRDDGYTNLYPIRIRVNGSETERNNILRYGPGKILQLTALGTGSPYYALIVHATRSPGTGLELRDADLWVLTKNIDTATVPDYAEVTFIDIEGTTDYTAYKRPAPVPQKTQPLVYTMDTPYTAGTLGRTPMTCISTNDIDYYKLNLNDGYTAVPTGANYFYREMLTPSIVRYWGAYRTENTTSEYLPPNQTYKYLKTQITPDTCDGVIYAIYTFRSVVTGNILENEPPAWEDDTINYDRCDGVCPDYIYITENDFIDSGTGWKKFALEKWVKGVYYNTAMTTGYNHWIFKQTGESEVYNDLYLVDNYQTHCGTLLNCTGAVIVDINLLNETNPYEEIMYAPFIVQACNPYCLEIRTDYTDRPILNLSAAETDFMRIEQELLRPNGLLGFNENRWTEEFSITTGDKRTESLSWEFGTWTTEWPTGKGFDVEWYRISLNDPNYVIESTTTPLTETTRKPGQIGAFTRVQYYKTSDGFYAIINDGNDDPIISVPGTIDIYDVITKEKPFVVFKTDQVDGTSLIGTYVPDLVATLVHYDGVYSYFLAETVPNCSTFTIGVDEYDCVFLPGDDLRFFEYTGTMPPGIFPDCLTGQDCIDTSTAIVNLFESPTLGNGYFLFAPDTITQDHCGVSAPGVRSAYDDLVYMIFSPYAPEQLTAATAHLGDNITAVADTAVLCGVHVAGAALLLFFLVDGTVVEPGSFDLDGETFAYTSVITGVAADVYPTVHTDLADEICIADDCFSGGTDCVTIPIDSYVSVIPTGFKTSETWDDGYNHVVTTPGLPSISAEHCYTGGIAYPNRSGTGKYIAQQTYVDSPAAQTALIALLDILDSGIGNNVSYSGGTAVLVNAVRVENKVYAWMLCAGTMPGISTVITFAGYPFTNSVYSPNDFSCWTWSSSTVIHYTICKSSSTQVYKLDQTAQEYEGELVSTKEDLLGYEDIMGIKTYTYTDETVVDVPWSGKFYDMMYLSEDPDYEILQEIADPHYVVPKFVQEGEVVYEETVDAPYVFTKTEEGEGEPLHYEGEDVYVGAYGFVPGEPAELWVMEGEATEGEICAVPECSENGTDCQPWPTTYFLFADSTPRWFLAVPGDEPLTESHCGLGPSHPNKQREHLIYTISGGAGQYTDYVNQLGQIRTYNTYEFLLAWVEVSGSNLIIGIVLLVDPGEPYTLPATSITFVPGFALNTSDFVPDLINRYNLFAYAFDNVEIDQLCVWGPYSTRGIIYGSVAKQNDTVFRNPDNTGYVLNSENEYDPRFSGIGSTENDPYFCPPGTTKIRGTLVNNASLYPLFERLLGRNYANASGEEYIFGHIRVDDADLALYFFNKGGTAVPVTDFYQNGILTIPFADLDLAEVVSPTLCDSYLIPDTIVARTNYGTDPVTNIQDDPALISTVYVNRANTSGTSTILIGFANPTTGCVLTGTQTFRLRVYRTGLSGTNPEMTVSLYENGVSKSVLLNAQPVGPTGSYLYTLTWATGLITNPNNVQIHIATTRPNAGNLIHIDSVRWDPVFVPQDEPAFHVYEYAKGKAPDYLAEQEQAGSVYSLTFLSGGRGYIFSADSALDYAVGLNGPAFPDHTKVYIDYTYSALKTSALRNAAATPYLGWNQVASPINHVIAGYDVLDNILRVYFLVSTSDACLPGTVIDIGSPTFETKTAADRVSTDFSIYAYDAKTSGNPEILWANIPYPDEYYGWECIDLSDAFFYKSYTGGTWILTSDNTFDLSTPYQTPITLSKASATVGFTSYSRTYGPYPKIEFENRYSTIVHNLGTDIRPDGDPVVITHVRIEGNLLKVFYLISGSTTLDAYVLDGYSFPMSILIADDSYDLVAYDYPTKLDKACKRYYSEKIECTENFTVTTGVTASTVDLRGYSGLSEVDFGTSPRTLYHDLIKSNDPSQYNTFPISIYSSSTALSGTMLTDYTYRIESDVDSFLYKDLNMFGSNLSEPIYIIDDAGSETEPRLDNFIIFQTSPLVNQVTDILDVSIGEPILLNGTTYGILTLFTNNLLTDDYVGIGIYETWASVPSSISVQLLNNRSFTLNSLEFTTGTGLTSTSYRFCKFDCATDLPIGKNVITAVGGTTVTANIFYKELSNRYWVSAYTATLFPVSATTVTVDGIGTVAITNYSAPIPDTTLTYANSNIITVSRRYNTPLTMTYDILDAEALYTPGFTKTINIVTYTDPIPFVGSTLMLAPSVPELGYHITVDAPTYLRFDPRLQTVSSTGSGDPLSTGDIYVEPVERLVTDNAYVNFAVTEDVSEASVGYQSIYVGDDVHTLSSVRGNAKPVTYANEGYCQNDVFYDGTNQVECEAAWTVHPFDKTELYTYTYKQDDYTIYLKDGTLYARPSNQYDISPNLWVLSEPEAFNIMMTWLEATEPMKEFYRVYLGLTECAGGEWTDPLDICEECNNVIDGMDAAAMLASFDEAYQSNVVIDEYIIDNDVQKFWIVEDASHLGLDSFMTAEEFSSDATIQDIWYYQTKPVGYNYWPDNAPVYNQARIDAYLPIIKDLIPKNVALDCLRKQLRDWQFPNIDRLTPDGNLRDTYVDNFLLGAVNTANNWGLINTMEPVAFQAPRILYLKGNGQIVANNVWGTMPKVRLNIEPHVGEYLIEVVRSDSNTLVLLSDTTIYYGKLISDEPLSAYGASAPFGILRIDAFDTVANSIYAVSNILDPWTSALYKYTVPSIEGTVYVWPREFIASEGRPWTDPPGYLIVCPE